MLVSKRCYRLCFTATSLTIDNKSYMQDQISRSRFNRCVETYLNHRCGVLHGKTLPTKIEQLSVVWHFLHECSGYGRKRKRRCHCDNEQDLIWTCLNKCVDAVLFERVQFSIISKEDKPSRIPLRLLACPIMKEFMVCMNNSRLLFPNNLCCYSNLERLIFQSVRICCNSLGRVISVYLPKLKVLKLYDCSGVSCLDIGSKSIEHVEIINEKPSDLCSLHLQTGNLKTLSLTWFPSSANRSDLELHAPELQQFVWNGFPIKFIAPFFNNLSNATIYLKLPTGMSLDDSSKCYFHRVFKVIKRSTSVHLHAKTVEILYNRLKQGNVGPFLLDGLETLYVDYCYLTDEEVPAIANCLKRIPDLKNIHVTSTKAKRHAALEASGFKMEYWEAQDLEFVRQLKTAEVEMVREGNNAAELVKYLAKHGEHLESLNIICPPSMASMASGLVDGYQRASTDVHVSSE